MITITAYSLRLQLFVMATENRADMSQLAAAQSWASKRKGFKHKLVLDLREKGFSHREATAIVTVIFDSMKQALKRHEPVELPFLILYLKKNPEGRAYRFGKLVRLRKKYSVSCVSTTPEPPRRDRAPSTFLYWGPKCPGCERHHPVFYDRTGQRAGQHNWEPIGLGDRIPIALECPCGETVIANSVYDCVGKRYRHRLKAEQLAKLAD